MPHSVMSKTQAIRHRQYMQTAYALFHFVLTSGPLRYKGGRSRDWHSSEFVVTHVSRDWSVVNSPARFLVIVRLRHGCARVRGAGLLGGPREFVGNNASRSGARCRRRRLLSSDSFVRITRTCKAHPSFVLCVTIRGHVRFIQLSHAHMRASHWPV